MPQTILSSGRRITKIYTLYWQVLIYLHAHKVSPKYIAT